jgi:hypothetical protein
VTVVEIATATATVDNDNVDPVESTVAQSDWRSRYPVRAVGVDWPSTCGDGDQVNQVVAAATVELVARRVDEVRCVGVPLLLDWLVEQPGDTWQQRWLASGADAAGANWTQHLGQWLDRQGSYSGNRLELMTRSLLVVVGADVLRPSLAWLLTGGKASRLIRSIVYGRDKAGFDQLRRLCERNPDITSNALEEIRFRCVRIAAAKGGTLADITAGDVLEILDAEQAVRSRTASGSATFRILREAGVLGADTPTLQQIRSVGQRSAAQLVDRYPITCRPVRGSAGRLSGRAATGGRLHHPGRLGVSPGAVFLVRPRATPPRHRFAATAARGRRSLETATAHQNHHHCSRRPTRRDRV